MHMHAQVIPGWHVNAKGRHTSGVTLTCIIFYIIFWDFFFFLKMILLYSRPVVLDFQYILKLPGEFSKV